MINQCPEELTTLSGLFFFFGGSKWDFSSHIGTRVFPCERMSANMQVTKIDGTSLPVDESKPMTMEEFQMEVSFFIAQEILQKLWKAGLITQEEHQEISHLNHKSFRPQYEHLLPIKLDIVRV